MAHVQDAQKMSLSGKRILFIGIGFYDYETAIRERLEHFGADVAYFTEQPRWHRSGLLSRLGASMGIPLRWSLDRHQGRLLEKLSLLELDYIFVIKGDLLSESFIGRLRASHRQAKFILYQWDSIRRVPSVLPLLSYFDRILSFDRKDCLERSDFIFRPLFFRESERQHTQSRPCYDLTFIGWLHSDRFDRLRAIETELSARGLRVYFYLFTGIGTYLRYFLRNRHKLLHFRKLRFKEVLGIMASSKCILDLPHPHQNGLTMRAIEAVSMRLKLVTTGTDIVNYDFFNRWDILPVEKLDADEIASFIDGRSSPVSEEILRKYSLDGWIVDVFGPFENSNWKMPLL